MSLNEILFIVGGSNYGRLSQFYLKIDVKEKS